METFDYVIRDKDFGSYYGYENDPEYSGWFLGRISDAVSYNSIAAAQSVIDSPEGPEASKNCVICKRTMIVEVVV